MISEDIQDSVVESKAEDSAEANPYVNGASLSLCRPPYQLLTLYVSSSAGEYKTILSLVSVLSHGKIAKRLADRGSLFRRSPLLLLVLTSSMSSTAIDHLDGVQNLRKAVYDYKVSLRSWFFSCFDASD